mmetsp:Transcript_61679/g.75624  ORF Transcript_61679/g.75624 Transcript_61679/m.75624 type:complete len:100 (+) Transcript_61679:60-359(+)
MGSTPSTDAGLSEEAKEIGQTVGASFKDSKMRKDGCFSCSGRPKTFVKSVTITERAYAGPTYTSGQTLSTTVGIEHEKDARFSHVWYRTQSQVCGCCWI